MIKKLTKHLIIRYIISGGTSAFFNLATFFCLYHFLHIYYLFASIIAFILAFFVSLILQKFWTFRDHSRENMHIQIGKYFLASIFGLAINTGLLYIFVDGLHAHPLIGQILAGGLTACCTFPISRRYIFNQV